MPGTVLRALGTAELWARFTGQETGRSTCLTSHKPVTVMLVFELTGLVFRAHTLHPYTICPLIMGIFVSFPLFIPLF